MQHALLILNLLILTRSCFAGDAFYVWQQRWSSNVVNAVVAEPATTIYPVATVVAARGESRLVAIPWGKLEPTAHRFVPVVRVPLKAFNRPDIETELARVAAELDRFDEIQLDLDCPESRFGEYATLIAKLRERRPTQKLSITALPAHLGNRAFAKVAKETDAYTLQVHGLDVPAAVNDPAELLNLRIAKKAIARADALGHPYSIALPCYAYELNFDPETGAFAFLTAECPARRQPTLNKRIAAKPADLIQLRHADRPFVWFRLPVAGDRLCWPRATLAEIQAGRVPENRFECVAQRISGSTFELQLRNENVIHASEVEIELAWKTPTGSFDLYRGAIPTARAPGRLPASITVQLPAPGQSAKIGWFATTQPPTTELKLK